MTPPRNVFSNFPSPRLLQSPPNLGVEDHNTQDEDEDLGPFETEVFSDDEGYRSNEEAFILLEWLDSFFLSHCERQPGDGKYHLPNNFTKKEVYDHYKTDMSQMQSVLQYSSFKRYWRKYYPLVTIPTTNKFSVCDFCELYKSKRDKAVTKLEKAEAIEALQLHRKQQAEERATAGRRRWKALDTPKDCAYIQIDGMDQKKTALPHFSKQPKSVDGAALVGVHLVGAMQEDIGSNIGRSIRERLTSDMCWLWHVPAERDAEEEVELLAMTTAEDLRRRVFGIRRPIYSGPRKPPPGSPVADRAAHIGELTEIHDKSFLAVLDEDEMASSSGRKRKANETEKLLDSFQERIIDLELENQYLSERVKLLEEENRQSRLKIDDERREKREQIETNDALVKINLALEKENGHWSRSYAVVLAKLKDVTNGNPSSIEGPGPSATPTD
ncbi:hypothetical protein R1sor_021871 [Riccia sorocarpa]|uniref:Uncharacterized protein n=1 Tax=Riccia sorocarpa TaxID=122646 RepID=A0ABD3GI82_9MARC